MIFLRDLDPSAWPHVKEVEKNSDELPGRSEGSVRGDGQDWSMGRSWRWFEGTLQQGGVVLFVGFAPKLRGKRGDRTELWTLFGCLYIVIPARQPYQAHCSMFDPMNSA